MQEILQDQVMITFRFEDLKFENYALYLNQVFLKVEAKPCGTMHFSHAKDESSGPLLFDHSIICRDIQDSRIIKRINSIV